MADSIREDFVYGLIASPDFGTDRLCFAARQSGLWRSVDGAESWQLLQPIEGASSGVAVTALALSPGFRTDRTLFVGIPGGVSRSTDGGDSWQAGRLSTPPPYVSALAVSANFEVDGIVLAATLDDGVFRSDDKGANWQAWNFGLFDLNVLAMSLSPDIARDRTVYSGTDTGIFLSKNTGRAWHETGFPSDCGPVLSLALSPQFGQDGILFAGTESAGVFRSADRGLTWRRVLEAETINAILISPEFADKGDMLVVSNDALLTSADGGQTWQNYRPDLQIDSGFAAASAPSGFNREIPLLLGLADGQILKV